MNSKSRDMFEFGSFKLYPNKSVLLREDEKVKLSANQITVLTQLVRSPGTTVDKNAILDEVWGPGANIGPNSVDQAISAIRKALGDSGDQPKYIKTMPGGYRFIAEVRSVSTDIQQKRPKTL